MPSSCRSPSSPTASALPCRQTLARTSVGAVPVHAQEDLDAAVRDPTQASSVTVLDSAADLRVRRDAAGWRQRRRRELEIASCSRMSLAAAETRRPITVELQPADLGADGHPHRHSWCRRSVRLHASAATSNSPSSACGGEVADPVRHRHRRAAGERDHEPPTSEPCPNPTSPFSAERVLTQPRRRRGRRWPTPSGCRGCADAAPLLSVTVSDTAYAPAACCTSASEVAPVPVAAVTEGPGVGRDGAVRSRWTSLASNVHVSCVTHELVNAAVGDDVRTAARLPSDTVTG